MKQADKRYAGDTAQYRLTMTLSSSRSAPRIREAAYYFRDYRDTKKSSHVFQQPPGRSRHRLPFRFL
jgi:hypothetical protein